MNAHRSGEEIQMCCGLTKRSNAGKWEANKSQITTKLKKKNTVLGKPPPRPRATEEAGRRQGKMV